MIRDVLVGIALSLVVVAAVVLRVPDLLLEPRFWAEEGSVFFSHALGAATDQALMAVHQGQFSLVPNLAAWLATRVPIEQAPAVTMMIALGIQALPALILATSSAPWADNPVRRTVAVLVVLVVGAAGESHATTLGSQFHLALAAAAIYLEFATEPGRLRGAVLILILIVAGLTGPQAVMLVPFFAYRWWESGRTGDGLATLILGACLCLHLVIFLERPDPAFGLELGALTLAGVLASAQQFAMAVLVYPISGTAALTPEDLSVDLSVDQGVLLVAAIAVATAVIAQLALLARGPGRDLVAAGWFIVALTAIGTGQVLADDRALAVPAVLIVLALLAVLYDQRRHKALRACAGFALLVAIALNVWLYQPRAASAYHAAWPIWRDEVAAWRDGRRDHLGIHPQWAGGIWAVELPEALRSVD